MTGSEYSLLCHFVAQASLLISCLAARTCIIRRKQCCQKPVVTGLVHSRCVALYTVVKAIPALAPCNAADDSKIAASPIYTSPEGLNYLNKPQEYSMQHTTDMFSMGCVLFELQTDLRAFGRPEDKDLASDQLRQQVLLRHAAWVSSHPATCLVCHCFSTRSILAIYLCEQETRL